MSGIKSILDYLPAPFDATFPSKVARVSIGAAAGWIVLAPILMMQTEWTLRTPPTILVPVSAGVGALFGFLGAPGLIGTYIWFYCFARILPPVVVSVVFRSTPTWGEDANPVRLFAGAFAGLALWLPFVVVLGSLALVTAAA